MSWQCPVSKKDVGGQYNGDAADEAFHKLGCMECKLDCQTGAVWVKS